jgi:hypothetical protein
MGSMMHRKIYVQEEKLYQIFKSHDLDGVGKLSIADFN